jgi:hypothetical protein
MKELKPGQANYPKRRRMRIATERSFGVIGKMSIATILQLLRCCYFIYNVGEVQRLGTTEYIGHDASVTAIFIRFYLLNRILDRWLRPPHCEGSNKNRWLFTTIIPAERFPLTTQKGARKRPLDTCDSLSLLLYSSIHQDDTMSETML